MIGCHCLVQDTAPHKPLDAAVWVSAWGLGDDLVSTTVSPGLSSSSNLLVSTRPRFVDTYSGCAQRSAFSSELNSYFSKRNFNPISSLSLPRFPGSRSLGQDQTAPALGLTQFWLFGEGAVLFFFSRFLGLG